jgi:beta-glucosidase
LRARIENLVEEMSLAEKIGQMTLIEKNSLPLKDVGPFGIGGVLSGGGGFPEPNTPAGMGKHGQRLSRRWR